MTTPDTERARDILRAELGIAPGDRLEVWRGVTIDQALRAITKALSLVRTDMVEEIRREAFEEAARVADRFWAPGASEIAKAIRNLPLPTGREENQ